MAGLVVSTFDWAGKRVLITGHTGFKGAWLSAVLLRRGAQVAGLALPPEEGANLFDQLNLSAQVDHFEGDIRDAGLVRRRISEVRPDVVFHMAAQSLVRRSYRDPLGTWSTNVMGTTNILDALKDRPERCACVVVTTDKVYENREWEHPYRETDRLGGFDPYSASKAATELVVDSYRKAFPGNRGLRMATARAGNVIGGGDWAEDRLLPDLARAFGAGSTLTVRNPGSIRPWQHVLDPLYAYITLSERLWSNDPDMETAFNFGPDLHDQCTVGEVIEMAARVWPGKYNVQRDPDAPHEASRLSLSIARSRARLAWVPRWGVERAITETVKWYRIVTAGGNADRITQAQIAAFEAGQ